MEQLRSRAVSRACRPQPRSSDGEERYEYSSSESDGENRSAYERIDDRGKHYEDVYRRQRGARSPAPLNTGTSNKPPAPAAPPLPPSNPPGPKGPPACTPTHPAPTQHLSSPAGDTLASLRHIHTLPLPRPCSNSSDHRRSRPTSDDLHPRHPAGLSSSSSTSFSSSPPTFEGQGGSRSDVTLTECEVATRQEEGVAFPWRRYMESTAPTLPLVPQHHALLVNRTDGWNGLNASPDQVGPVTNGNPNLGGGPMQDSSHDFEPSCLVRTPSGSLFIPSDMQKGPSSPATKSEIISSHALPIKRDMKNNPDRCHLSYSSAAAVPVLPVRNSLRRPVSSHFAHSRLHLRKTLSSHCSWKCTAIGLLLLSVALVTALAYFMAVAILNGHYARGQPCPVMVEDMELLVDGTDSKSTYRIIVTHKDSSRGSKKVHSRPVRDVKDDPPPSCVCPPEPSNFHPDPDTILSDSAAASMADADDSGSGQKATDDKNPDADFQSEGFLRVQTHGFSGHKFTHQVPSTMSSASVVSPTTHHAGFNNKHVLHKATPIPQPDVPQIQKSSPYSGSGHNPRGKDAMRQVPSNLEMRSPMPSGYAFKHSHDKTQQRASPLPIPLPMIRMPHLGPTPEVQQMHGSKFGDQVAYSDASSHYQPTSQDASQDSGSVKETLEQLPRPMALEMSHGVPDMRTVTREPPPGPRKDVQPDSNATDNELRVHHLFPPPPPLPTYAIPEHHAEEVNVVELAGVPEHHPAVIVTPRTITGPPRSTEHGDGNVSDLVEGEEVMTTTGSIGMSSQTFDTTIPVDSTTHVDLEQSTRDLSKYPHPSTSPASVAIMTTTDLSPPPSMAPEVSSHGVSLLPAKTFPPESEKFTEVHFGKQHTQKVPSYGHWNVQFYQMEASLVKFNYTIPSGASVGVYGRKNGIPTHTRYDFVEILTGGDRRSKRATQQRKHSMEFIQFLDRGLWYISIYNDDDQAQEITFVPIVTDESSLPCPYDCHGHGSCVMGGCVCDSDFAGESCAYRVCPVLCSGRGQYIGGECTCSPGWKGRECQLREDECEVPDCSGHGDCMDGSCHCFPGYKGQHCEEVDCLDPDCSGHGVCVSGMCLCRKGWKGADCSEADSDALRCLPDCSGHGQFDLESQQCVCDERWTGPDCSQEQCDLDCGPHGKCQSGECICLDGWSGSKCNEKLCDPRCLEHGQCKNGTCLCIQGWNGRHCTLEGCPRNCNDRGDCIITEEEWHCRCQPDWDGPDCSVPLEKICDDRVDNDNDGLVDCADSECCSSKSCENNPLCFAASDPLDILLRKQPPAVTASFFQRMQFLIEEDSVQSYAHKNAFNDSRASVIRGQVVSPAGSGLTGIRVGVATDQLFGFTVTRDTGWFDLMVNGGGAVTLQFQREPFRPQERTVAVPWNEIMVIDKVVMTIDEEKMADYKPPVCTDHDYDIMKPVVLATWKHGFQGGCPEKSSILAESQVVQESLPIPGTDLHLVYHSSRVGGYLSTIQLQLTPDHIPPSLRLIHLKISIEGILFEKIFEADPGIKFTYAWNRRNVYRQKVYGVATATVFVGYEYTSCPEVLWDVQTTQLSGHDMSISEIGGWNLDIHHRYNFHEGILQKGDGTNIYLKNKPKVLLTTMGDGQQRPLHCHNCNGVAKEQRLLAPVSLASAPDGSVFVGDFNLIRRITPDGLVATVVELSAAQVAYRYHLAVGPADGKLYISDPERHQILRAVDLTNIKDVKNNIEVVVGNGGKCLPGDKLLCGDGRSARDARLAYPKGIAISVYNEIYIADATNIRVVDRGGIIHTLVGDHYHKSHWKPIPCSGTILIQKINLRWPTELSINPLDSSLHILDDHMVLKLTQDKRIRIIAGKPAHCPSSPLEHHKSDLATEVFLESPQSIAFAPNGDLYIAESDSQVINRVRVVGSDGRISKFAGAELKCNCMDINCKCFEEDHYLAVTSKLNTISSITVTPNGLLHICDQGNMRIRSVTASLPKPNALTEYEIFSPETQEIYVFNRHGQHVATKSILTGKTVYTFSYNVNTSFGKLSTVTDAAGNKIYILRDYSNQVNTIENTQGGKCRLEMSRMRMLQSFTTPDNFKTVFDYHGSTGLLRSKIDSSGRAFVYSYDEYGRLTEAVTPSGQLMQLEYSLSVKGASVTILRDEKNPASLLIKGTDVTTRTGASEERITQHPDGSLTLAAQDTSLMEMETIPSSVIADVSPVLAETFPVPARLKNTLSDDVVQRFEWRYYLRREGKGRNRQIIQVGRKMKINGETLLAVEFDREQYSETVYDRNQIPLVTVHYDPLGHPLKWQPSQNVTPVQLEYDRFGRLKRWERGHLSERFTFDIHGRLAEVRHADNSGIMYKYEEGPIILPSEIILPSGSRYLLQYDASGSLQAVITPNGHKHEIATQTSLGFYKLLYLAPGVKHPYVVHFNDRGQMISKMYPRNKGRVTYIYNDNGQLESIFCGHERTDFHYHEKTALVKSVSKSMPDLDFRVDYRYHGALVKEEKHRFSSRSGLDGVKFRYRYEGRLAAVEVEINGKGTIETKFRYNVETGLLDQVQQFLIHRPKINSIFIQDDTRQYSKTIGMDAYGRIVVLAVTLWNKEIFSLSLHYDNRSRVMQTRMKVGKDGMVGATNYNYTLDGFLEEVSAPEVCRFIYDINGNMKSVWEGQRQLSLRYDEGDRLVGYGDVELYVVDDRGFIVQRGEEKFRFNAEGQLVLAFELHQYEVHYYYDAMQRLIARRDHRGNITQFFYSDPLNTNLVTHIHYPKDGITFTLIYDPNAHLMFMQQGTTKYYVATDHLGSPIAVFGSDGNIVKEVRRSPFGKVTMDSNPEFVLPIDFQGGLRDPVTQLVHFRGRVYDPVGAQWLTPNWEDVPQLLEKPYLIHSYRFHNNDPINKPQLEENHLTELPEWLSLLGYNMDKVLISPSRLDKAIVTQSFRKSLPVISGLSCSAEVVSSEFHRFSTVPRTEVKVEGTTYMRRVNSRIANLPSVLGDGVLISRTQGKALVHVVNEASPILRDVFVSVFNDSSMVDFHFSLHGQDSFFFVQEDFSKGQEDWDQLQRLGTMYNVTMHPVDSSESSTNTPQLDIRMTSPSVVLNIRYGSNLEEERRRLIRQARRRAIEEAWQQEAELLRSGHRGAYDWAAAEKEELLASGVVARYYGTDVFDIDKFPELADDPTNVVFRKESSRRRRGRSRRPRQT